MAQFQEFFKLMFVNLCDLMYNCIRRMLCVTLLFLAITDCISITSVRLVHYILAFETHALSFPLVSNGGLQSIDLTSHNWYGLYQEMFILPLIIGVMLTICKVPKNHERISYSNCEIQYHYATFSSAPREKGKNNNLWIQD